MGVIYQSDAWSSFERSLGHKVICAEGAGWKYLAVVMGGRGWRWLSCPYGPEVETPEAFDAALASLERTARQYHCWFVRGGPGTNAMMSPGETVEESFHRRALHCSAGQGAKAYFRKIDLTQDESAILRDMKPTNRNLYRNIHKKGVTFSLSTDPDDIELLLPFLDELARARRFNRVSNNYLRQAARTLMPLGAATLYVARLHGEPIGASLVYDWKSTRTYAYAAMDFRHRRLSAGVPLVVRMVLDAKQKEMSCFDLMGVASGQPGPKDQGTAGYTAFKESFGGRTVSHTGVWELPLNSLRYAAYPTLRTARYKWTARREMAVQTLEHAKSRLLGSP